MKFFKDKHGELAKCFQYCIDRYFPALANYTFLYLFREGEKLDSEENLILAEVSKISPRDRDIYGFDIRVEVYVEYWNEATNKEKLKLAYHELCHIEPIFVKEDDPDSEIKEDKEGRLKYKLIKHDVVIRRFSKELEKFGLSEQEEKLRKMLNSINKAKKQNE